MTARDMKKELRPLYAGHEDRVDEVDVPELRVLALDRVGDPATALGPAAASLYAVAYALKFAIKARDPALDYVVMPLELLNTAQDPAVYHGPGDAWPWTVLVLQPEEPTAAELRMVKETVEKKGTPAADVTLRTLREGHAVQTLHVGPYDTTSVPIGRLEAYMAEHGLRPAGHHHEIYLSDPNRVKPQELRTLHRWPVAAR